MSVLLKTATDPGSKAVMNGYFSVWPGGRDCEGPSVDPGLWQHLAYSSTVFGWVCEKCSPLTKGGRLGWKLKRWVDYFKVAVLGHL